MYKHGQQCHPTPASTFNTSNWAVLSQLSFLPVTRLDSTPVSGGSLSVKVNAELAGVSATDQVKSLILLAHSKVQEYTYLALNRTNTFE